MAYKNSKKKSGGTFSSVVVAFIVIVIVVAFVRSQGSDPGSVWGWFKDKSEQVQQKYNDVQSGNVKLPSPSSTSDSGKSGEGVTDVDASAALKELSSVKVSDRSGADYDRDSYKHWILYNGSSCWDVRDEVLYRGADSGSVVLLDKDKKETTDKSKACSIESGQWTDPYTGKKITNPRSLDIDHIVPLKLANDMGASKWNADQKQKFANDVDNNLLAVSASANRSKGDKGPSDWLPSKDYQCAYVAKFVNVVSTYNLSMTSADKATSEKVLKSCG